MLTEESFQQLLSQAETRSTQMNKLRSQMKMMSEILDQHDDDSSSDDEG